MVLSSFFFTKNFMFKSFLHAFFCNIVNFNYVASRTFTSCITVVFVVDLIFFLDRFFFYL